MWPLSEPAPRRQALAMATQGKCGFQGGASRPDPGERGVPPARGGGGTPQSEGGTGPNHTKTSPNGPKMRFGAILDHLEATFIHFGSFEKV